jgi:hypothetical protein
MEIKMKQEAERQEMLAEFARKERELNEKRIELLEKELELQGSQTTASNSIDISGIPSSYSFEPNSRKLFDMTTFSCENSENKNHLAAFQCCSSIWCCYECHNKAETHSRVTYKFVCLHCKEATDLGRDECMHCGVELSGVN